MEEARQRNPDYVGKEPEKPKLNPQSKIEEIEDLKDKNAESRAARRKRVAELRQGNPCAVVSLAVTYYTGKVDTVPHVPDRCYVADGYRPQEKTEEHWTLRDKESKAGKTEDEPIRIELKSARSDGEGTKIPVQFIVFVDHLPQGNRPEPFDRCVAYFFHVNGNLVGKHTSVRAQLQEPARALRVFCESGNDDDFVARISHEGSGSGFGGTEGGSPSRDDEFPGVRPGPRSRRCFPNGKTVTGRGDKVQACSARRINQGQFQDPMNRGPFRGHKELWQGESTSVS
ncbi:MAG: hypothetical protein QM813_05965 [Verrucomicrobiota bacterium]